MAGQEVNLERCVVQPSELDWLDQPEDVVLQGAANGIPEALEEARRRWPSPR